jgi:hypothetical protein
MSDLPTLPVGPVPPVGGVAPTRPVQREAHAAGAPSRQDVAAVTGGSLKGAYAQIVINPDTHDVVIRVRDAVSHAIISEYPSSEIEHMAKDLNDYLDTLRRRRSAARNPRS